MQVVSPVDVKGCQSSRLKSGGLLEIAPYDLNVFEGGVSWFR